VKRRPAHRSVVRFATYATFPGLTATPGTRHASSLLATCHTDRAIFVRGAAANSATDRPHVFLRPQRGAREVAADYRRSDVRIVENGFAASSGVSKSAKVVLAQNIAPRARPRVTVKFADGPCGKATPQQNSSPLQVQTLLLRLNGVRPGANERMGCNRLGYPAECGTH
jgi:hypothetical protein